MVIAATNDTDVNIRVYEDAEQRAMLVNVVDVPPLCNFILPGDRPHRPARDRHLDRRRLARARQAASATRSPTSTASPTRGSPMLLNEVRGWAKGTLPTYQDRKEFFESIVNGEPDPIELLRQRRRAGRARPDRRRAAKPRSLPDELTHLDDAGPRPDGRRGRQGR